MEDSIEDPANDRVIKKILPPPMFNLSHSKLFPKPKLPDWIALKEHLTQEGYLDTKDVLEIIDIFYNIVKTESNTVVFTRCCFWII